MSGYAFFLLALLPHESVEALLRDLERHIKFQASEGVAVSFHSEFKGSGLLAAPPASVPAEKLGSVTIRSWRKETSALAGSVTTLNEFFRGVSSLSDVRLRLLRLEGGIGSFSLDLTGVRPSGVRFQRRESYTAEWRETEKDGWLFFRLQRVKGELLESSRPLFVEQTGSLGLRLPVQVRRTDLPVFMEPFSFLGGIAAGDYDRDGDLDLYIPMIGKNLLFRNEGKQFVKTGEVQDKDVGAAALFVDLDNDGWLDLLLANVASEKMPTPRPGRSLAWYRNLGNGKFEDRTKSAGLNSQGPAMSLSASDVDRDGDLDFYVCYYKDFGEATENYVPIPADILQAENGVANQLWINQGNGTFREEGEEAGGGRLRLEFCGCFRGFRQ